MTMTDRTDDVAPTAPDAGPAPDPAPTAVPTGRRARAGRLALVGALVLTAALGAWGWRENARADDLAAVREQRAAARSTASDAAELLLGLDAGTGRQTLAKLRALATGDFADQVDTLSDTVAGVLRQGDVASRGTIAAAAVEKLEGSRATVLVAATALVTNSELPRGELRTFRMAVGLTQVDEDGSTTWKVDDVEFLG